jgi:hypothetical protein
MIPMSHPRRVGVIVMTVPILLGLVMAAFWIPISSAKGESAPAPLPAWLTQLNPGPDSSSSGIQVVEVKHSIVTPEYIRLIVDGVDVTAYATKGPGLLDYRPAGGGPVSLSPGRHEAEVELMSPATGGGPGTVLASHSWSFTIS